jgi:flagellar hook-basal body complex protein FliE
MIGGLGAIHLMPSVGASGQDTGLASKASEANDVAGSFAAALEKAAGNAVGTLQNAERMSVDALKGNADTRQVVDAVMDAQQVLQTAVAIRDKIVSAYLDVSRMSI